VPHPSGGRVDAFRGRFGSVRYTFDLHVTGRELSEFTVTPPKGVKLSTMAKVTDATGKTVDATVNMDGSTLKITFAQPVAIRTKMQVELDQIKMINNAMIWDLETAGKLSGINQPISLMTLRMRPGISR
jgi:hypothetical protein